MGPVPGFQDPADPAPLVGRIRPRVRRRLPLCPERAPLRPPDGHPHPESQTVASGATSAHLGTLRLGPIPGLEPGTDDFNAAFNFLERTYT